VQAFDSTPLTKSAVEDISQDRKSGNAIQSERRISGSSRSSSSSSELFEQLIGSPEVQRPPESPRRSSMPDKDFNHESQQMHKPNEWRLSIPAEAPPELISSPKSFCEPPDVEEDLVLEDVAKPSKTSGNSQKSPTPLSSKEPSPPTRKVQKVDLKPSTKENPLQSRPATISEVTAANSLLKDENEMLRKVRMKLKEVAKHVSHLQTEVYDQQEVLRSSLLDVRTWAAEATQDAVSQEVLKYQSELNSAVSTPDASLPLATPFT